MNSKILFILNPESGNGRGARLHKTLQTLIHKAPAGSEVILTEGAGHAEKLTEAHCTHFHRIVVVGGDGTLNEALNGFNAESEAVLGIIPAGSGNDFAKTVGMTGRFEADFGSVINGGRVISADFGEIEYNVSGSNRPFTRRFINSAGVGFDAVVSEYKNNSSFMKGLPQYISAVLKSLIKFSSFNAVSRFDENYNTGRKLLIAVSNGKTYGGGFKINPEAEINDNLLDACIIGTMPVHKVLLNLSKLISGKHGAIDEVHMTKFSTASILPSEPVHVHADGEVITSCAVNIKFKVRPNSLRFITNLTQS